MVRATQLPGEPGTIKRTTTLEKQTFVDTIKNAPWLFIHLLRSRESLKEVCETYGVSVSMLTHVVHELFMTTPRKLREPGIKVAIPSLKIVEGKYRTLPIQRHANKALSWAFKDGFSKEVLDKSGNNYYAFCTDNVILLCVENGDEYHTHICYKVCYGDVGRSSPLTVPTKSLELLFGIC